MVSPKDAWTVLDNDDNKIYPPHQNSGDVFAFPPWRLHAVDKVKEKDVDRLIVAGNISLTAFMRPD